MKALDRPAIECTLERLAVLAESRDGKYPTHTIEAVAKQFDVSSRTVWRWIKDGLPPVRAEAPLSRECLEAIAECHGRRKRAWKMLTDSGAYTKSYATFCREFQQLDPMMRQGLTKGVQAALAVGLYMRRTVESKNSLWVFDHTMADVRLQRTVSNNEGEPEVETFRPWISLLIDHKTRFLMAATVIEGDGIGGDPTEETLVAFLASAIRGQTSSRSGTFVGGVPAVVQADGAKTHFAEAMLSGYTSLGISSIILEPGSPWEDGIVERMMRTVKEEVFEQMPGLVPALSDRYQHEPWRDEDRPTIDQFIAAFELWIEHYNYTRVHSELGTTPFEAWKDDSTQIERVSDDLIRHCFLRSRKGPVVQKDGITFNKVRYTHPDLGRLVGKKTTIRHLKGDQSFIAVYIDDEFVCTAVPHARLSAEDRHRIVSDRKNEGRRINRLVKKGRRNAQSSFAQLLSEVPETDPTRPLSEMDQAPDDAQDLIETRLGDDFEEKMKKAGIS